METANIERYLINDSVFNEINKKFISLDSEDMKNNNRHLAEVFHKLIEDMKRQSPLFNKTFQRIMYVGSYYKKTRIGKPDEYDLNFVINLPFKEKDMKFISQPDCPSYIKIRTTWKDRDMSFNTLNLEPKALSELNSFIDNELYLNQDKFRTWMEGILSKVTKAYESSRSNQIILSDHIPITIKKAGPAFTLVLEISGKLINIDVVPVLTFSTRNPPPKCSKIDILEGCSTPDSRYWSAVPKPLDNSRANFNDKRYRYWRLCFDEFEKDIFAKHGQIKPIIRHLKKLRDTQRWNIASYYIETLCLNELDTFGILKGKSYTILFFTMLQKLREAFHKRSITYFWDEDLNLLEHIGLDEMNCIKGRIDRIIKKIERTIINDKYAIARYILNEKELHHLQSIDHVSSDRPILYESSESEPEPANQWRCVIV